MGGIEPPTSESSRTTWSLGVESPGGREAKTRKGNATRAGAPGLQRSGFDGGRWRSRTPAHESPPVFETGAAPRPLHLPESAWRKLEESNPDALTSPV